MAVSEAKDVLGEEPQRHGFILSPRSGCSLAMLCSVTASSIAFHRYFFPDAVLPGNSQWCWPVTTVN
jgi:hypothetical protein